MYFGEVTEVCRKQKIPNGFLNVESFENGRIVQRGKAFFYVRDGHLFLPGKNRPEFSDKCWELRMPREGDTLMFDGIEIHRGFFVVTGYGYYRQWRYIRDQMKTQKRFARIGFEQLSTASVN